jgi:hypothetical protein
MSNSIVTEMSNLQMGTVRVYSGYSTFILDVTANYPFGEIFERALLVTHKTWNDIYRLDIENQIGRRTWSISDSWWMPLHQLWNRHNHSLNIYIVGWEQAESSVDREWIRNTWNSLYTAWKAELNAVMIREMERRNPTHSTSMQDGFPFLRNTNIRPNRLRPDRGLGMQFLRNSRNHQRPEQTNSILQELILPNHHAGYDFINVVVDMLGIENVGQNNEEEEVLTEDQLNEIAPITVYSFDESNDEELVCPIAHEPIRDGEEIRQLPCQHIFKAEGITRWLTTHNRKCPVCRENVQAHE